MTCAVRILFVFYFVALTSTTLGLPIVDDLEDQSAKVVGGVPANPGEFPFVVSLQAKGRNGNPNLHSCGAVLYNMTRLITAARCVLGIASNLVVAAGANNLADALEGRLQKSDVKQIIIHPDFVISQNHDDIAVVDLKVGFSDSMLIQPLQLAANNRSAYPGVCVIAGWGATNGSNLGQLSDKLMKGDVQVHPKDYCKAAYPDYFKENFQICANGVNGEGELVDACNGDKGGPLICTDNGHRYLAGIYSWAHMCGSVTQPGVFMEISKYRPWLDSLVHGSGDFERQTTTPPSGMSTTTDQPTAAKEDHAENEGNSFDLVREDKVHTNCRSHRKVT